VTRDPIEPGDVVFVPRLVRETYRLEDVPTVGYDPSEVVLVQPERLVVRSLFSDRVLVVLRSGLA